MIKLRETESHGSRAGRGWVRKWGGAGQRVQTLSYNVEKFWGCDYRMGGDGLLV
jgi:hypothetical protein